MWWSHCDMLIHILVGVLDGVQRHGNILDCRMVEIPTYSTDLQCLIICAKLLSLYGRGKCSTWAELYLKGVEWDTSLRVVTRHSKHYTRVYF